MVQIVTMVQCSLSKKEINVEVQITLDFMCDILHHINFLRH